MKGRTANVQFPKVEEIHFGTLIKSLSNVAQNNFVPKKIFKITITLRIIITCFIGINNSINFIIKIIKNYLYGLFNIFLMVLWHLLVWLQMIMEIVKNI